MRKKKILYLTMTKSQIPNLNEIQSFQIAIWNLKH